ncbi:MAG: hypothetical protein IT317_21325 [Anaerolineales bacterium]|nr:hypothetical protein [Anaerolineales bacterium]
MTAVLHKQSNGKGQSGQIAVMFALVVPLLIGFVGLVVDGGLAMVQYRRAQVALDSAALAAAAMLDEETFVDNNVVQLLPTDGYLIAARYVQENGQGHVSLTGFQASGTDVVVHGTATSPTVFLRIFGINQVHFDLSARAELKYGITEEGQ